jgi:DNA-binding transcriptional LysR family regulator
MELSDLMIFRAVVEQGGVIAAAKALHRVPSNISARLHRLEQSLGSTLFYRERQRLRLTPKGQQLLPFADQLLALAAEARKAVSGMLAAGVLKLGALESTAASRLPELLASFHRSAPNVRLELTTGTNDALTAGVLERRLHAAFVAERPREPEVECLPAYCERLVLISRLGRTPIRRPRDIRGAPLIAFPQGCAYRRALERWLGREYSEALPMLEMASYHAVVACVAAGTGVALVPESVLKAIDARRIAQHAIPAVHARQTTYLIFRVSEQQAALDSLVNELRKQRGTPKES